MHDDKKLYFRSDLKKRQASSLNYGWEDVNEFNEMFRPQAGVSQAWYGQKQGGVSCNLT